MGNEGKEVSRSGGAAETEGVFPGSALARRAFTCCNRHQTGARAVFADFTSRSPVIRVLPPGAGTTCSTGARQRSRRLTRRRDHARALTCSRGLILRWDGRAGHQSHARFHCGCRHDGARRCFLVIGPCGVCLTCRFRGVSSHRCARVCVRARQRTDGLTDTRRERACRPARHPAADPCSSEGAR